jgi:hypothetical protein
MMLFSARHSITSSKFAAFETNGSNGRASLPQRDVRDPRAGPDAWRLRWPGIDPTRSPGTG